MSKKLESIIHEYRQVSKEGYENNHTNPVVREIVDLTNGIHFLLKKYYKDPKIKEVKAKYTEAVHEELVNKEKMPYNLAVMVAKAIPMPVQNKVSQALLAVGYGIAGPGRTHKEVFDIAAKYTGIPHNWLHRGTIVAELGLHNWTAAASNGLFLYGVEASVRSIYNFVTGDNINTDITRPIALGYMALEYAMTLKHAYDYEKKGKYRVNWLMWTRLPAILFISLTAEYHRLRQHDQQISKSTHILNT